MCLVRLQLTSSCRRGTSSFQATVAVSNFAVLVLEGVFEALFLVLGHTQQLPCEFVLLEVGASTANLALCCRARLTGSQSSNETEGEDQLRRKRWTG